MQVDNWALRDILTQHKEGSLKLDPPYQRGDVWSIKKRALLIDSIAREIPSGAITVFASADKKNSGVTTYEVIDGRQRLTAVLKFMDDEVQLLESYLNNPNSDESTSVESRFADEILTAGLWSKLETNQKRKFLEFKFPVFVLTGTRESAVQSFVRMNEDPKGLVPQEIRNAIFHGTPLLKAAQDLGDRLDGLVDDPDANGGFFVKLRLMTKDKKVRMHDHQFLLETLIQKLHGEQHRRDELNRFCTEYKDPSAKQKEELDQATDWVFKAFNQIWTILDGACLKSINMTKVEDDMYALIGAMNARNLFSASQIKNSREVILEGLSEFFRQVLLCFKELTQEEDPDTRAYPTLVQQYARQQAQGGQVNSQTRRIQRREILMQVLDEIIPSPNAEGFSPLIRAMIWAKAADKICARCGEIVTYDEFDAGHIVAKANGGASTLDNGQIEHKSCNRSHGAKAA